MYISIYACIYLIMYLCMCLFIYSLIYAFMHELTYSFIYLYLSNFSSSIPSLAGNVYKCDAKKLSKKHSAVSTGSEDFV